MEEEHSLHSEQIAMSPNSDFSPSWTYQNSAKEEKCKVTFSWKTDVKAKVMKATEAPSTLLKYHSERFLCYAKDWDGILSKAMMVNIS